MTTERPTPEAAELDALAKTAEVQGLAGPAWSLATADLNLNLVRLPPGDEIPGHVNAEVDVVYLVVTGSGSIQLGEAGAQPMAPGRLFVVPKGLHRAIRAGEQGVIYLTCHRRRAGLMPRRAARRDDE